MSGYLGPELFDPERTRPLWRRADGRLKALHSEARHWLLESASASRDQIPNRPPLPLAHIVVVALLLGFLLMTLLYKNADESEGTVEKAGEDATTERLADTRQPRSLDLKESFGRDEEGAEPAEEAEARQSSQSGPNQQVQEPAQEADRAAELDAGELDPPKAEPTPELDEGREEQVGDTEPPANETPDAPDDQPQGQDSPEPQVPEDEQILLSWESSDYTLQLLGASSRQAVLDYIERQPNSDKLLSFESRRQGKPWFVVVSGRYDSNEAARDAIEALPPKQREAGPWPRPLDDIQADIEAVRRLP